MYSQAFCIVHMEMLTACGYFTLQSRRQGEWIGRATEVLSGARSTFITSFGPSYFHICLTVGFNPCNSLRTVFYTLVSPILKYLLA